MISNPIIRKEVLSSLRMWKAFVMQGAFLLVAAGLIWLLWPAEGLQDISNQLSRKIISVLSIGQLVMVALFAPAFTAASLTSEREKNTLESLFVTAMKPWEIAVGKITGSLVSVVLLAISGVPALATAFLLGGVQGSDVLAIVGILLLTAVYLGMIGLLVSTMMHRSYRAIIVTYGILLVLFFLLALPAWPISNNLILNSGPLGMILHVLASLSPLEAMLSLLWPASTYTSGIHTMPSFWQLYIPMSVGISALIAAACLYKLHRPVAPPRPREKLKVIERDGKVTARDVLFLVDPRKRKRMIRWWQNPILVKEFRTRPMLQSQWLLRLVSICLIASILLMFLIAMGIQAFVSQSGSMVADMATAVAVMMVIVLVLIGPAMSGGTLCADRESGVWELIRSTRLSSFSITVGKFMASLLPLLLLILAMTPALVILLYFNKELLPNVVRILAVAGMSILFVTTAGMFFSSVFSKTSIATAWTYAVMISMGLLTLLVLLASDLFSPDFVRTIFMLNPVAAAMDAAGNIDMQRMGLFLPHIRLMALATLVLFGVTVVRVFQLRRPE